MEAGNPEQESQGILSAYRDQTRKKQDSKQALDDLGILVLDSETSGLNPRRDRLLSLASIEIKDRAIQIESLQDWLVHQDHASWNQAIEVHGILPSASAMGQPLRQVLLAFLQRLGNKLIVGHHIGFDIQMINKALKQQFNIKLRNRAIDTAQLAQQELSPFRPTGYANQRPPGLDEVCVQLGIPAIERHTAAGDAFTTAEIFVILTARMRQRRKRPLILGDFPLLRY
ncbi:3'-5' exonuclease [Coraliomargarita parva]|uniref:3'-5' exonuclease n=1 Tax=Coraliomargarita parva TaxID=3014050 RepID=UPI0022B3F124|nr:3'-5' exonuclease [Coraliomargarita parva]